MICVPVLGQQGRVQELRPPSHLRDRRNAFALPLLPQTLVANLLQQWCHGRNQATFNLCIGATLVELAPQDRRIVRTAPTTHSWRDAT